ncbi:MAG TPA: 2-hydroxychromene-2-carboxylate isomerase [Paenalcaligenes sp.]|nr:2-hydroxychromene-2-carboxylate isomerase [Paenalcaligenes sp.]
MIASVEFHFDFGSPNAYLSHRVIPRIQQRTGCTFEYVPILLGGLFKLTNNEPPMVAYENIPAKSAYARRESERFIQRYGLHDFRRNPFFPVNTLKIMRASLAAKELGCFEQYIEHIFKCMWEHELNMSVDETIIQALDQAGLDGRILLERAQEPHIKELLIQNTQRSADMGAFGVPTFFVNNDIYFGKDKLPEVQEVLLTTKQT